MRLRTILVAAPAALLLTIALTAGAPTAVASTASPSATAAHHPAAAPTTLTISRSGPTSASYGVALTADIAGPNDVTKVTADIWPDNNPSPAAHVVVSLALQSGSAAAGTWQTPTSLGLPDGQYLYTVSAVDASGRGADYQPVNLNYEPSAVFHDMTVSPTVLSYAHHDLYVNGRVTTYDPGRGDTGQPLVSADLVRLYLAGGGEDTQLRPDGTFSFHMQPGAVGTCKVTVDVFTRFTVDTYSTVITQAASPATRILLDQNTNTGGTAGSSLHITGTAQYKDDSGAWQPWTDGEVWASGTGAAGASGSTDSAGRFDLPATVPDANAAWTVQVRDSGGYLQIPAGTFTFGNVQQGVSLSLYSPDIDQFSDLSFYYWAGSTSHRLPNNRVYLLESPNGITGWRNLGYIPVNGDVQAQQLRVHVDNPHGYWMLYSPAAPGYAAAQSNVIHTFRYATLVTGGKPNTTRAHRGQVLSFSGKLWQQGTGSWLRMKGARVLLAYRLPGSNQWHVVAAARTTSSASFTLRTTARANAYWAVFFLTPNSQFVDAMGPLTFVHVR